MLWFSRKGSLAWAGVARSPRLLPQRQVLGSHCLEQRLCPLTAKSGDISAGVWPSEKVMFRAGQAGCGLSVLGGSESSQLPSGS